MRAIVPVGMLKCSGIGALGALMVGSIPASAQIVPDGTLPNNSILNREGNVFQLDGGTSSGTNLFHSFSDFSVPTSTEVFFNNSVSVDNIISRVTGSNISHIDGLIRTNGTANLFLLNSNGILFGTNARLDIGGSFLVSTADRLLFNDGVEFSTAVGSLGETPLLSVNVPVGLQFNDNASVITGVESQLELRDDRTLSLVGSGINLEESTLFTPGGQVELIAIRDGIWRLDGSIPAEFVGGIINTNNTTIDTSSASGGRIQSVAETVELVGRSRWISDTLGEENGAGISITAGQVQLSEGSALLSSTQGSGRGGDISVVARDSIRLTGTGFPLTQFVFVIGALSGTAQIGDRDTATIIATGTTATGVSGDIDLSASRIEFNNGSVVWSPNFGTASGGSIALSASESLVLSGSLAGSGNYGLGNGGDLIIETDSLTLREGGLIAATNLSPGEGGNAIVRANTITLLEPRPDAILTNIIVTGSIGSTGPSGDIDIQTDTLSVRDGSQISTTSGAFVAGSLIPLGGNGGQISILARESVEVIGFLETPSEIGIGRIPSIISSATFTSASAGALKIETPQLQVENGGTITADSVGSGQGASIEIVADTLEVTGSAGTFPSRILASAGRVDAPLEGVTGDGGSAIVRSRVLALDEGGEIAVRSLGTGNAGLLAIDAEMVRIQRGSRLDATTVTGNGGNIDLQVEGSLQLHSGGQITARSTGGTGNGGNLTLRADTLVALDNSDIIANSVGGRGGNIEIETQGIFGTEFRTELTSQSDITASSEFGVDGIVQINNPEIDSTFGVVELPENPIEGGDRVVSGCSGSADNRFSVVGRGGLPETPDDTLRGYTVWEDLRSTLPANAPVREREDAVEYQQTVPDPLTEATGWEIDARGQIQLIARISTTSLPQNTIACQDLDR